MAVTHTATQGSALRNLHVAAWDLRLTGPFYLNRYLWLKLLALFFVFSLSCSLLYNSYLTASNFHALFRPTCGTVLPQAPRRPGLRTGQLPQLLTLVPRNCPIDIIIIITFYTASTHLSVCCLNSSTHLLHSRQWRCGPGPRGLQLLQAPGRESGFPSFRWRSAPASRPPLNRLRSASGTGHCHRHLTDGEGHSSGKF